MVPQGTVFLFLRTSAVAHDDYSAEDHHGCQYLLPCESVHSDAYAYCNCDYRLDVCVHAHEGRPDTPLSHRNQKIGYEGCADYQVGEFSILDSRDSSPVQSEKILAGNRE